MHEILTHDILKVIWWVLLGVLLIGFLITDGFDLGVGMLLKAVTKTKEERQEVIGTIAPIWEGNQVWLITGAGAMFAAWPIIYSTAFSCFYLAMLLILGSLILRPVAIDFHSKVDSKRWSSNWEWCLFISGFVPSLLFGVAIGNVLTGVDFTFDEYKVLQNHSTFLSLISPISVICGLVSVSMVATHGACYLALKTKGKIQRKSKKFAIILPVITVILFILGGVILKRIDGYSFTTLFDGTHQITKDKDLWLNVYNKYHGDDYVSMLVPLMAGLLTFLISLLQMSNKHKLSFLASSFSMIGIFATFATTTFPFILPSRIDPYQSLHVWNASSSHSTLLIMLFVTVIFIPLILAYTAWVYSKINFKKKI